MKLSAGSGCQVQNFLSEKDLGFDASEMMKTIETEDIPILTRRETEVLQLIANRLTNAEMAARLFISPTTVDTHRKHLLEKFNARNTATLIKGAVKKWAWCKSVAHKRLKASNNLSENKFSLFYDSIGQIKYI